ncbi:MAG TPA: type IV pilus biogenesis/stability protein PilW [Wenzhouxiangella sp.]|nr:type IV pilus biogenesis/stability protein PilW [Wenzhouxiangella sp.]
MRYRLSQFFVGALLVIFLAGCATSPGEFEPLQGRNGMDRVSPVRAAEVNTRLGIGYMERGQLQLAIEKLQTALSHDSAHTPARLTLALIYDRLGESEAASQQYQRASQLAPGDGPTQNAFAVHLCQQGRFADADRHFQRAVNDAFYATPEIAYSNAGSCARRAGEVEAAERYLRQALRIDPDYPDALFQLAELQFAAGDAFRARAFLQRLETATEADPAALILGYRIEQKLNNPDQAERYAMRLERLFPQSLQARELRSLRQGDD